MGDLVRPPFTEQDALRVQAAAIAAQQAALEETEVRLQDRQALLKDSDRSHLQKLEDSLSNRLLRSPQNQSPEIQAGWHELRLAQKEWRQRRNRERAVLRERSLEIQKVQMELVRAQEIIRREQAAWEGKKRGLEEEILGLEMRIRHQRDKLQAQAQELARLDGLIQPKETETPLETQPEEIKPPEAGTMLVPAPNPAPVVFTTPLSRKARKKLRQVQVLAVSPAASPGEIPEDLQRQTRELERWADELADQRLRLLEFWERLALNEDHWRNEHDQLFQALAQWGGRLEHLEETLAKRQKSLEEAEEGLRAQQESLARQHQTIVAWQSRIHLREADWQAERELFLEEVHQREENAEQELRRLLEIRDRWEEDHRKQREIWQQDMHWWEQLRQELAERRQDLLQQAQALADEKKKLADQTLALEQYRKNVLGKDARNAEAKLEQAQEKWSKQTADMLKRTLEERGQLQNELTEIQKWTGDLAQRFQEITSREAEVLQRQARFEEFQAQALAQLARREQVVQAGETYRRFLEEEITRLRDEIDRIANALLQDPLPRSFDQAA